MSRFVNPGITADLVPENANVYIEIGYGWACGKQKVLLVNNPNKRAFNPNKLPFDIRQQRYIEYKNTEDLNSILQINLIGICSIA